MISGSPEWERTLDLAEARSECERLRELLREADSIFAIDGKNTKHLGRISLLRARIREALGEGADRG